MTRRIALKNFVRPTNLWRFAGLLVIAGGLFTYNRFGVVVLDVAGYKSSLHTLLVISGAVLLLWPIIQEAMRFAITMRTGKPPEEPK